MNKKAFLVLALFALLVVSVSFMNSASAWEVEWTEEDPAITYFVVYAGTESIEPVLEGGCTPSSTNSTETEYICGYDYLAMPAFERGERATVRVVFESQEYLENAMIRGEVDGKRGKELEYQTNLFDVYEGRLYGKELYFDIPSNWDADGVEDYFIELEIEADSRVTGVHEVEIEGTIQRVANTLKIMSVNLRNDRVEPGQDVRGQVVVKNMGNHELEDLYLKVTVTELGISNVFYLGDLEPYDDCTGNCEEYDTMYKNFELPLPKNTQEGIYTLEVEVYNDEISREQSVGFIVEGDGFVSGDVEITPQITRNDVEAGESVPYTLIVTNNGNSLERFVVTVSGTDGWSTTEIMPASFSLGAGESELVTINLNVDEDAVVAEHLFSVEVSYGENDERFNFIANVADDTATAVGIKEALLIIGVVLAAIIVILLIVLLTRRPAEEKPEESYY